MVLLQFHGAYYETESNGEPVYHERSIVWVNMERIGFFYDHKIFVDGQKIVVMETAAEIQKRISAGYWSAHNKGGAE